MKRRDILKGLTLLPFAGGALGSIEPAAGAMYNGKKLDWFSKTAVSPGPLKAGPQVYQSIGVEPIINGRGTFTIIGASIIRPEAEEAMKYAHMINTQLDELAYGVGQRLGEVTQTEWGVVGSGCAGSLKICAIGILSGGDPEKLIRIPFETQSLPKNEVILYSGSVYDHGIRALGVKYYRVNTPEALEAAIGPKTAMVYLGSAGPTAVVAKITKAHGIPLIVDAAADRLTIPPIPITEGADVVAYSGGKVICGPQSAGLLLGNKKILQAAWQSGAPHHGPGRDNKVGREEQIGMLAAVEAWATRDHAAEMATWVSWCKTITDRVAKVPSVVYNITVPSKASLGNASPGFSVTWDPNVLKISGAEVAAEMQTTSPRVAGSGGDAGGAGGGRGGRGGAAGAVAPAGAPGAVPAAGGGAPTTAGAAAGGGRGGRGGGAPSEPWTTGATSNPVPPTNTASFGMSVYMMGPNHDKIVGDKLYAILTRKRDALKAADAMKPAGATLTGRWDVMVEYFNSMSPQTFVIEKQDGNFMQGMHKGSMSTRDLAGTIEGDKVVFSSRYTPPAITGNTPDAGGVTMTFYGTVSGDNMSGDIDMGEYITAKFTAKKYTYPQSRRPIAIPVGRPLSS